MGHGLRDGMHAGALVFWLAETLGVAETMRGRVEFALTCVPPVLVAMTIARRGLMTAELYDAIVTANLVRFALPDFLPLARQAPMAFDKHLDLVRAALASPNTPCMVNGRCMSCYVSPRDTQTSFATSGKTLDGHSYAFSYECLAGVGSVHIDLAGPGLRGAFVCVMDGTRNGYTYYRRGTFTIPLGTPRAYVLVMPHVLPARHEVMQAPRAPGSPTSASSRCRTRRRLMFDDLNDPTDDLNDPTDDQDAPQDAQ